VIDLGFLSENTDYGQCQVFEDNNLSFYWKLLIPTVAGTDIITLEPYNDILDFTSHLFTLKCA